MMTSGDLKDRIRFERNKLDANGDATGVFEPAFTVWANVLYLRASEPVMAQRLQGVQPAVITVYRSRQSAEISNLWRCVDDGLAAPTKNDFFAIRGAVPSADRAWIEVTAERGADG